MTNSTRSMAPSHGYAAEPSVSTNPLVPVGVACTCVALGATVRPRRGLTVAAASQTVRRMRKLCNRVVLANSAQNQDPWARQVASSHDRCRRSSPQGDQALIIRL